jgi:DNA polymerase-3 subunit alpha
LRVGSIELLPDVKDTLVESITIEIDLDALNDEVINELSTLLLSHPGKADLYFRIKDGEGTLNADLKSRSLKVSVQKDLINYIKSHDGLEYKVN